MVPSHLAQTYFHPILDRQLEGLLFNYLREGSTLDVALQNPVLKLAIEKDPERWTEVLVQSKNLEDLICSCNLRLVDKIARRRGRTLPLYDRINAGNIGLLNAVRKFDPDTGNKLSTYAAYYIGVTIDREEKAASGITYTTQSDLVRVYRITGAFQAIFGREATIEELKQQLLANTNLSMYRINNALEVLQLRNRQIRYIHEGITMDSETELAERIVDKSVDVAETVIQNIESQAKGQEVRKALYEHLDETERKIIESAFGVDGEEKSLEEIAQEIMCPIADIRSVLDRSLAKLRGDLRLQAIWQTGDAPSFVYHLSAENAAFRLGLFTSPADILEKPQEDFLQQTAVVAIPNDRPTNTPPQEALNVSEPTPNRTKVKELVKAGLSYTEIGERLGVTKQAVSAHVSRLRRDGELAENVKSNEENLEAYKAKIKELLNKGLSYSQIGEGVGSSRQTVGQHVRLFSRHEEDERKDGVKSNEKRSVVTVEEIKELMNHGISKSGIARKLGIKLATASRYVKAISEGREINPPEANEDMVKKGAISEETELVRQYLERCQHPTYKHSLHAIFEDR